MAQPTNLFLKQARLLFLLVVAALAGGVSGVIFAYSPDLPAVTTLDDYAPYTITRVYAAGGEEIGQFATERRVIIGHDEIPEVLRQALISSEDANFFNHFGRFNLQSRSWRSESEAGRGSRGDRSTLEGKCCLLANEFDDTELGNGSAPTFIERPRRPHCSGLGNVDGRQEPRRS